MKRITKAGIVAVAALGLLIGSAAGATAAEPRTNITVPDLPITAATCTTDGALPWTATNAPAQNANGWEFYDLGFRVYIDKAYDGPGTYTATVQRVGAGAAGYTLFPNGTDIVNKDKVTQILVVDAATGYQSTDPSAPCFVPLEAEIPTKPYLQDRTGAGQDKVIFPTDSVGGTWKISSITGLEADGDAVPVGIDADFVRYRIAFTPDANYVLPSNVTWDRTVDGKAVWLFYADNKGHVDTVFAG